MRDEAMPCLFSATVPMLCLSSSGIRTAALLAFRRQLCVLEKLTPTEPAGSVFYVGISPRKSFPEDGKSWLLSAVRRFKPAILAMLAFSFLEYRRTTLPIFVIFV